jgi:hypothetical protein
MMPICSVQAINEAVVITELSALHKLKTKTFIEAMGTSVIGKRLSEYRSIGVA